MRRVAFTALRQEDFLEATVGDRRYGHTCKALFSCGSPLATETGMDRLLEGDFRKARQMLQETGYDGTPIVLLQASDAGVLTNLDRSPRAKRIEGVELYPACRKGVPPARRGRNLLGRQRVVMTPYIVATCGRGARRLPVRRQDGKGATSTRAQAARRQKQIAREVQVLHTRIITHIPLGEWYVVAAVRSNVELLAQPPPVTVFWGLTKK